MMGKNGRKSELVFLALLLVALFWNVHGKTCSLQSDCEPIVTCEVTPWTCNGSDAINLPTVGPTAGPSSARCCVHLGFCGTEIQVAGWVNVRKSDFDIEGSLYKVEWMDTFITEGNGTEPALIGTDYVGSWNSLTKDGEPYPKQMFVAEPTNSCSIDGTPKWPEWYQVTAKVMTTELTDLTLEIEPLRVKDCLCDAEWDCHAGTCYVETKDMSNGGANLSKTNEALEDKVADYCRNLTELADYSASSNFAVGFDAEYAALDTLNFSASVEGGWAPDLNDTGSWIEITLAQDTIISGIMTQGMALNAERRVDKFQVEYEASTGGPQSVGPNMVFIAGARLDTKMINSFPVPVKANRVRLLIMSPCDPYYIGLRVGLVGCAVCTTDGDCTDEPNGLCEIQEFCTYSVVTTEATTTLMPTTSTPGATTDSVTTPQPAQTTGAITSKSASDAQTSTDAQTSAPGAQTSAPGVQTSAPGVQTSSRGAQTTARDAQTTAPDTQTSSDKPTTNVVSNIPVVTTESTTTAGELTTAEPATQVYTTQQPSSNAPKQILDKIDEMRIPENEKVILRDIITNADGMMLPTVDVTKVDSQFINAGLEVIRNVTVEANTTQNAALQRSILLGAWNFVAVISEANEFTSEKGPELFNELVNVINIVLDEDRKEAWHDIQQDTNADPLGIIASVESVAVNVAASSDANSVINITVHQENIEGLLFGKPKAEMIQTDFEYTFEKDDNQNEQTTVTIPKESFNDPAISGLAEEKTVSVVILKFDSIEDVLSTKNVIDNTPMSEDIRLSGPVLSISVVGADKISVPVTFKIVHDQVKDDEDQHCSFWAPVEEGTLVAGRWKQMGCETTNAQPKYTECTCSHTTNYAILMWLGGDELPTADPTLQTITTVGCLVSIIALAVAVGLLAYLKSSLSSERIIIHMHLMGVTLAAVITFFAGVDKTESKGLCQFITIALHFFYMSMFSWMLVEGIHLYRQIIAVFESEKSRLWVYFVVGWGIPVIVVGVTTGIFFDKYGTHSSCWLSVNDNSLWAFTGPIIPIILVNLVVLFMVCRIVISAAKMQQEKPGINSAKAGLRSSLLLLPILGVTWIFGYFSHVSTAMMYIFVSLNSFQGFFMALFHCFMSSEVNGALKQKIRKVKDSSLGGSSVDSTSKPAMFTSGMRKVKVSPSQTDQTDGY